MTDEIDDRSTALANTPQQLPARASLVNRGVALAEHLLSSDDEDRQIAASLSNARQAWITALELASECPKEGPLRDRFREASLNAYHWGLHAAMTGYKLSFQRSLCADDPNYDVATAAFLLHEGQIGVDIGPQLLALRDDSFKVRDVCTNIETFLEEVTAFCEHGSPYMRLLVAFTANGEELRAALKWPNFIVNIDKIVRLAEEDAGETPGAWTNQELTLKEIIEISEARTRRARMTLEEAYRMVVSPTT